MSLQHHAVIPLDGLILTMPVKYVGSMKVAGSIVKKELWVKSAVSREATARCCEAVGHGPAKKMYKPTKRGAKAIKKYLIDDAPEQLLEQSSRFEVTPKSTWVKMVLSPMGMALQNMVSEQVMFKHHLHEISCAVAFVADVGEKMKDYVTYVSKCKGVRYVHVFDCSEHAGEVIDAFGQIFGRGQKRNPIYAEDDSTDSCGEEEEDTAFGFGGGFYEDETSDGPIYEDYEGGNALYADTTVDDWNMFGFDAKPKTPSGYITITSAKNVKNPGYLDIHPTNEEDSKLLG